MNRLRPWIAEHFEQQTSLLRSLVEASSYTMDPAGVARAASVLRAATSLPFQEIPSQSFGPHLVLHGPIPASEGGVVLVGHLDTVFPAEEFSGYREEGGKAFGPGVLDMKGGIVVTLFALQALAHEGLLHRIPFSWVLVSDEEVGSPEGAPLLRSIAAGAKAALVFEAGRAQDRIITRRRGTGSLTTIARGKAAHAGNAHAAGANAVWALSRWIDHAQALTNYATGRTVNVGTIRGGSSKNTVPDAAVAETDLRYETQDELRMLQDSLTKFPEEKLPKGTSLEFRWGPIRTPMERTEESEALFQRFSACQQEEGLGGEEHPLVGGGSDGCTTAAMGIATIDGLGVRGEGFHTRNEYAELASLTPKTCALANFLLSWTRTS